jgi:hypothetical protein
MNEELELFAVVFMLDDSAPISVEISDCSNPAEAYAHVLNVLSQEAKNIARIQLPSMQTTN